MNDDAFRNKPKRIKAPFQSGFTLIETLIALSIFTLLIAAITTTSQAGLSTIQYAESRTIANRALANVLVEFEQAHQSSTALGQYSGAYQMGGNQYDWEIVIQPSENQLTRILEASLIEQSSGEVVANMTRIW